MEWHDKKIFEFSWDWRNFMNSNKEHFEQWKRETQFVCLSKDCSKGFLTDSFHNCVLQSVNNCSLQVGVRFYFKRAVNANFTKLTSANTLEINGRFIKSLILPPETAFHEVRLSVAQLTSVHEFQNVCKLSISVYDDATMDLSCLVKVEELEISGLALKGYHRLGNLKKASFRCCIFSGEEDFSCFATLCSLSLSGIEHPIDISALNEVQMLKFDDCQLFSGWSSLGKSRELSIGYCGPLGNVFHLGNVEKLGLIGFTGNAAPLLNNVIILNLSCSENLKDVSCLAESAVVDLNLSYCYNVSNITMLRKVKRLDISECRRIIDLTGLLALTDLVLVSPVALFHIQSGFITFSQLKKLTVSFVRKVKRMILTEEFVKAPLKEIYLFQWEGSSTVLQVLNSLKYLQSLEIVLFHGDLTIPAISSLGNLNIRTSRICVLSIHGSNQCEA
jgi:hypothetical protein